MATDRRRIPVVTPKFPGVNEKALARRAEVVDGVPVIAAIGHDGLGYWYEFCPDLRKNKSKKSAQKTVLCSHFHGINFRDENWPVYVYGKRAPRMIQILRDLSSLVGQA